MTRSFRYWLADLISGGELSRAEVSWGEGWVLATQYAMKLDAIAAMETPSANGTVKRMARTAREAVK